MASALAKKGDLQKGLIKHGIIPNCKTNIFSQSSRSNEAPQQSNYRGAGLSEMIYAMENNIKHRCNADVALHVVEMIESTINVYKELLED